MSETTPIRPMSDERLDKLRQECHDFIAGLKPCRIVGPTEIASLLSRLDRLQAVVDRLPVTADGVPVVPGMAVFEEVTGEAWNPPRLTSVPRKRGEAMYEYDRAYSTREAALATGKETKE